MSSYQRVNYIQSPPECHATPAVFPKLNRNYHEREEARVTAWESFLKRYLTASFRCYLNCAPFKRRRTLLHTTDLDNRHGSRCERSLPSFIRSFLYWHNSLTGRESSRIVAMNKNQFNRLWKSRRRVESRLR